MMACEVKQSMTIIGGTTGHVTTKMLLMRLNQLENMENCCVNIIDTWGVTAKNYKFNEVDMLLSGYLPTSTR